MGIKYFTHAEVLKRMESAMGGKSQAQFATDVKVSQQALNDAVRGKRRIPDEALAVIGLRVSGWIYEMEDGVPAEGEAVKRRKAK